MRTEIAFALLATVLLFGCAQAKTRMNGHEASATDQPQQEKAGTGVSGASAGNATGTDAGAGGARASSVGQGSDGDVFQDLDSFSATDTDVQDPDAGMPDFALNTTAP